ELLNFPKLDVNAVFHNGKTPLHQAIEGGSRDFVLLLLQQGADPNAQDADGLTPLQLLCSKKPRNYNISMISTWTLEKTSLMPQDAKSKTPLHYAAEAGHVDAVELLLE
ncbi:ankyrin, partial [Cenococcum geophilum 1.58]|uniref:ankyrin n=1 Tax=Cenococcum geophilum 1.58 TaxID=794803 RepID=UPI00358E8F2F